MRCHQCGLENPKQSKFCRKCGTSLRIPFQCPQCGSENLADSIFCTECGERLSGVKRPVKGNQRKCKACGHFNELDALFCVACSEEITRTPRGDQKRESGSPSYKMIGVVIGMIFLIGIFVKIGTTFFKAESPSKLTSAAIQPPTSVTDVNEAQVIAVARNFKCACGGCGELPLATCECDMPKGAIEEKNFIRGKLGEGFTVKQVIKLLDENYGHRV
jgi:cytochrome c-type biogenesis protein CcmH/NrfF